MERVMTSSVDAGLAAVVRRFGPPEVIQIETTKVPAPDAGQVRVRVQAAGVGPWDVQVRSGKSPVLRPLPLVIGAELAGVVETVGFGVSSVAVGDVVYGVTNADWTGAHAELALADEARISVRPIMLTSIEAAAVPVVACTALQMVELADISVGMRTLVLHDSGNVGQWTTRLALRRGAEVVAVVQASEVGEADRLGARQVFTSLPARTPAFDLVLDTVGGVLASLSLRLLRPGGRLVSSAPSFEPASFGRPDISARFFAGKVTAARLGLLSGWIDGGGFPVQLGEVLPLRDAILAHRKLEGLEAKAPGGLVLRVAD